MVVAIVASGVAVALACYFVNGYLLGACRDRFHAFQPLRRTRRRGVGQGARHRRADPRESHRLSRRCGDRRLRGRHRFCDHREPLLSAPRVRRPGLGTWIVRGFGTAIMHGGTTAIFAVMSLSLLERARRLVASPRSCPGSRWRWSLHSAFNHLTGVAAARDARRDPRAAAAAATSCSSAASARSRDWLGHGFDADTQMLESITSGHFPGFARRPVPRVAEATGSTGAVVADLSAICACIPSLRCAPRAS